MLQLLGFTRSCTICAQPTFVVFTTHIDICKGFNWHCRAYLCLFMWRSTSVLQFLSYVILSLQLAARAHKVMCHLCTTHINFCCFFLQHTMRSALQSLSLSLPHRHLALHPWMGHFNPCTFSQHVKMIGVWKRMWNGYKWHQNGGRL